MQPLEPCTPFLVPPPIIRPPTAALVDDFCARSAASAPTSRRIGLRAPVRARFHPSPHTFRSRGLLVGQPVPFLTPVAQSPPPPGCCRAAPQARGAWSAPSASGHAARSPAPPDVESVTDRLRPMVVHVALFLSQPEPDSTVDPRPAGARRLFLRARETPHSRRALIRSPYHECTDRTDGLLRFRTHRFMILRSV